MSEQPAKSFFKSWTYALFWVSSLLSNIGTWMQQVAQPWLVLNLSNSAMWVGIDSFALNVPGLLFTLPGGIMADRFERKRLILFFQAIQFACIILLVVLVALGWIKVWMIVCISFVVGLTDSLSTPAFQTIIPSIVNAKDIPTAVSLNSTQFNLSRLLGPALAGMVIARFGSLTCFAINAASYIPFFISIFLIYPKNGTAKSQVPVTEKENTGSSSLAELIRKPLIRLPIFTTLFNSLFCSSLITFCPVLIKNVFNADTNAFGWAMAAFGLGGLAGAGITFTPIPALLQRNRFANLIAILLAVVVVMVSLNKQLLFLNVLLILAGALLTASNISVNTFLQEHADNNQRGRIAGLFQLALFGGISAGSLITGFVVSKFGINNALLANGILGIMAQLLLFFRQFRIKV